MFTGSLCLSQKKPILLSAGDGDNFAVVTTPLTSQTLQPPPPPKISGFFSCYPNGTSVALAGSELHRTLQNSVT